MMNGDEEDDGDFEERWWRRRGRRRRAAMMKGDEEDDDGASNDFSICRVWAAHAPQLHPARDPRHQSLTPIITPAMGSSWLSGDEMMMRMTEKMIIMISLSRGHINISFVRIDPSLRSFLVTTSYTMFTILKVQVIINHLTLFSPRSVGLISPIQAKFSGPSTPR